MGRGSGEREAATSARLRGVLEPVVAAAGYDLEAVSVSPAGKRQVLRVVVDGDDGVDLDAVAALSRRLSDALDAPDGAAVMGERPYTLEVTSPGVDRPLTEPRHWRRASGRLVTATLVDGSTVTGRVRTADDAAAVLDVDGAATRLPYPEVAKARVEVEFSRPEGEPWTST